MALQIFQLAYTSDINIIPEQVLDYHEDSYGVYIPKRGKDFENALSRQIPVNLHLVKNSVTFLHIHLT